MCANDKNKRFRIALSIIFDNISRFTHSSDPHPIFKGGGGGVSFDYHPRKGGICKIKKRGWKYGAGAGLLKRRGADTFPI